MVYEHNTTKNDICEECGTETSSLTRTWNSMTREYVNLCSGCETDFSDNNLDKPNPSSCAW